MTNERLKSNVHEVSELLKTMDLDDLWRVGEDEKVEFILNLEQMKFAINRIKGNIESSKIIEKNIRVMTGNGGMGKEGFIKKSREMETARNIDGKLENPLKYSGLKV